MLFKSFIVLASVSAAFGKVFITQPTANTKFTGGAPATINWQDDGSKPSLEDMGPCKISIYAGNANQQTSLQTLSESTDVSKLDSLDFAPKADIGPNSSEYFIRIESLSLKDDSPQKYPAMAFSAKFNLDGMSGQFNQTVQDQIKGQTTAPLSGPTAAASGSASATSGLATSKAASSTASSSTTKKPSASASSAALPLTASAGWIGALLSAVVGVTLF